MLALTFYKGHGWKVENEQSVCFISFILPHRLNIPLLYHAQLTATNTAYINNIYSPSTKIARKRPLTETPVRNRSIAYMINDSMKATPIADPAWRATIAISTSLRPMLEKRKGYQKCVNNANIFFFFYLTRHFIILNADFVWLWMLECACINV